MIIVTDLLRLPFDEGAKNTAYNILSSLSSKSLHSIISLGGDERIGIDVEVWNINKTFIDFKFLLRMRFLPHDSVLYVPESSATLFSIIRAKLLKLFANKAVSILALQPRRYFGLKKLLITFIAPEHIITPSISYSDYLLEAGLNSIYIPLGVNNAIYKQCDEDKRKEIRKRYDISCDKTVLLHVGHICKSRNLDWLIEVKKKRTDIEVIVVGSTYNESNTETLKKLEACDILVINRYVENMAEIYNLANYYVFPVINDQAAISTPLSVLEAMSCNVPIITTRFGSLVDMFMPDKDFYFVKDYLDIIRVLDEKKSVWSECTNSQKVQNYTWKSIAKEIEMIVEQSR